jgi:hypothetical protein
MSVPNNPPDDKENPDGPRLMGFMIAFAIAILVLTIGVYFFLGKDHGRFMPHKPNPAVNSSQPL